MIPVAVHGAEGRMGLLVTDLVAAAPDLDLVALITEPGRGRPAGEFHPGLPLTAQDAMAAALPPGCVVVDFSVAPALDGLLAGARAAGARIVSGTTGFAPAQTAALEAFSRDLAVVHAANFSLGVPALRILLERLAAILPPEFMAEQVETHHRHKKDRPSGTAVWLAEAWRAVRGGAAVPTHSLRVGGVVGEHAWTVSDHEETLQLVHRAHSRRAFLRGVAPAVRFVSGRDTGLYGLTDVLGAGAEILGGRG